MNALQEELEELVSAEEFLEFFGIDYDLQVVRVNRLHILQRFHNYLQQVVLPDEPTAARAVYAEQLSRAYQDFVRSDALTEKVFKVFRQNQPQVAFVPLASLRRTVS